LITHNTTKTPHFPIFFPHIALCEPSSSHIGLCGPFFSSLHTITKTKLHATIIKTPSTIFQTPLGVFQTFSSLPMHVLIT